MLRPLIRLFLLLITLNSTGQDYIEYQKTFNRIDEDVLSENYTLAIERLDSIHSKYEFIYARHCIKALQICITANDSVSADKWLAKCFIQGVPIWIINSNDITKNSLQYSTTQNTIIEYDSLFSVYRSSTDTSLARQIDSLFAIDQIYTRKANDGFILFRYTIYGIQWLRNNKRQFEIINEIIENKGYPGERLIGLDFMDEDSASITFLKRNGPVILDEKRAYFMLIHYYTTPRKDINYKLMENVVNGYLPAYQFGALNDFMAKWGKQQYGNYQYFNVWHCDINPENIDSINKRRLSIGLNTFEQQQRNNSLEKERFKNKRSNSEILTE